MPAKGKSKVSPAQRIKIAAGRMMGKTAAVVARETGLALDTVKHQTTDARTLTLVQELKASRERKLAKMYDKNLNGIDTNLNLSVAKKDPHVFLRASREFHTLLLKGDPPPRRIDPARSREGGATYAELLESYSQFDEVAE